MIEKTKTSIQNQRFQLDLKVSNMLAESVIKTIADYLPLAKVSHKDLEFWSITDHLKRKWLISNSTTQIETIVTVSTPVLAYEDMDEFLYLVQELQQKGAKGGNECGLRLFVSTDDWPRQGIQNLCNLIASRLVLLSHALLKPEWDECSFEAKQPDDQGMVEVFPEKVASNLDLEEMKICIQLGLAIAAQAANQKWANPDPVHPENERYAFRCWLLRMGLIGEDYKVCRMRLLKRLKGDSATKANRKTA